MTFLNFTESNFEQAVNLYSWNIAASSALWSNFHLLEVSLRNILNRQMVIAAGRDEWWKEGLSFDDDTRALITQAIHSAKKRHPYDVRAGHVIAEFSLGFWIVLLSNRYHARLWEVCLRDGFKNFSGRRRDLHRALEQLRKLRNRIAHHEPIFDRNLRDDYKLFQWLFTLMSPKVSIWIAQESRFSNLLASKQEWISGNAQRYL